MLGFLSVCGTWIYPLLPAFHAHLPCTTLLNSEECALSEKKKKKGFRVGGSNGAISGYVKSKLVAGRHLG